MSPLDAAAHSQDVSAPDASAAEPKARAPRGKPRSWQPEVIEGRINPADIEVDDSRDALLTDFGKTTL
ncbi:MAG: hypothetical protein PVI23_08055, partial [Maricaulaceae bacterium]